MRGSSCLLLLLTTWSVLISDTKADWFDDIVDGIHEKLVAGADYLKNSAAPAIREKFNEAKGTLQDPETHHKIKVWIETEAIPVVKEKFNTASEFVQSEVVPELKKIVDAYQAADWVTDSSTRSPPSPKFRKDTEDFKAED